MCYGNEKFKSQNSAWVLKEHTILWMDNDNAEELGCGTPMEAESYSSQIQEAEVLCLLG